VTSLAKRIIVAATLSTAVAAAVAGSIMWLATRATLLHTLDQELAERTQRFTQRGAWILRPGGAWRRFVPPDFQADGGTWFLQVFDLTTGTEINRSPSLHEGLTLATAPILSAKSGASTVRLSDGRRVRLWVTTVIPQPPTAAQTPPPATDPDSKPEPKPVPSSVYVASDTAPLDHRLHELMAVLVGTWLMATALAAAASAWLSRTVLRPVHALSQAITHTEPTRPGAHIGLSDAPRELQPVVDRLNEMFARVESAFQRERTTIADIAHELRTPVTVLRATLEFSLAREHPAHSREVHERCLRTAIHLQGLITSLLMLARLEAGQEPLTYATCDVVALLRTCWEPLHTRASERSQTVDWQIPDSLSIHTAEDKLRIIVSNVLDNAVSHGVDHDTIRIALTLDGARLRLTISNATTATAIDSEAVFTPFWRGDSSRTGTTHSGLGLALARRVAGVLGGTLTATCVAGRFTVQAELPIQS